MTLPPTSPGGVAAAVAAVCRAAAARLRGAVCRAADAPVVSGLRPVHALAVLTGALAAALLPVLPPRVALLVLAAIAVALLALPRARPLRMLALLALGFAWTAWRAQDVLDARLPHALEGRDLVVVGTVAGLPESADAATRFDFDLREVRQGDDAVPLRGSVRLAWYGRAEAPPVLAPCERWRLTVRLKRPHGLVNPGGFDGERHAAERGIVAAGYVRDARSAERLGRDAVCADRLRARLSKAIATARPPGDATTPLLQALAVGDQRGLDAHAWDVLRATGVGHLIAISGLHVGLAAIVGALAVRLLWWSWPALALRLPRRRAEAPVALLAATAYGALAGFGLPTTRTLLMIAVGALAIGLRRHVGAAQGLALALLAILLWDPLALLSAGFWLSFVGVAMLLYTLRPGRGLRAWLLELGWAQAVMTLALLPLTVALFGQSSLVGPLANAVAVPLMSFVIVPVDLLAVLLLGAGLPGGAAMLALAASLMRAQWQLLERLAAWPLAQWYWPEPSAWALALAALGVLWLLLPRGAPARALGVVLLLPLLLARPPAPGRGDFEATVLDVGQGLAVLVRTQDHALLFDAGARFPSGYDLGEAAVTPSLRALGVRRLDLLVVSHGDNDHAGGARAVQSAFPQAALLGSEPRRSGLPLAPCQAGQSWSWNDVDVRVVHPGAAMPEGRNDGSCVLLIAGRSGRLLLSGDIEARGEAAVAAALPSAPTPLVLQVPHHGSKTSSGEGFLQTLAPRAALVSAGYRSRFGHPHPRVVERYRALAIPLFNTADAGALRLTFAADGPHVESERARRRRWWRD